MNTSNFEFAATMVLAAALAGALLVLLVIMAKRAPWMLAVLVLVFLASYCWDAEATQRFEVAAVIESEADRPAMQEAAAYAARIYRDQLGVDLAVTVVDVNTVATHTQAQTLLQAVQAYRVDRPQHLATDATVFFTRREMTRGYQGIATIGPACSAGAAAVVTIKSDGLDGQILAHELAHTVGVPHDHAPGYLMSETLARGGSDYMSPDSVQTFKAAPAECMAIQAPPAASAQRAESTGGGGAVTPFEATALLVFAGLCILIRRLDKERAEAVRTAKQLHEALMMAQPPGVLDIVNMVPDSVPTLDGPPQRYLHIRFNTLSDLNEFHQWLLEEHRKAYAASRRGKNGGDGGSGGSGKPFIPECSVCGEPGCPDHGM